MPVKVLTNSASSEDSKLVDGGSSWISQVSAPVWYFEVRRWEAGLGQLKKSSLLFFTFQQFCFTMHIYVHTNKWLCVAQLSLPLLSLLLLTETTLVRKILHRYRSLPHTFPTLHSKTGDRQCPPPHSPFVKKSPSHCKMANFKLFGDGFITQRAHLTAPEQQTAKGLPLER